MDSPFRARTPSDAGLPFCPVVQDSLGWVPFVEFDASDKVAFRRGAERLFQGLIGALLRWVEISPEQPRARQELSDAYLLQRRREETAAPEALQGMAEVALQWALGADSLRGDTSPGQLVRLANLYLAAGQGPQAIELASQAIERYAGSSSGDLTTVPGSLINVLVVSGQTSLALAVGSGRSAELAILRPGTDELIPFAGAEPILERISVLGAMGVHGPPLDSALASLANTWSIAGYSNQVQQLLRRNVRLEVAVSLVEDSTALSAWAQSVEAEDPLWQAVILSDDEAGQAEEFYWRALNEEPEDVPAIRAFLLGTVSGKLGWHAEAIRHYSRLDSMPHSLSQFDPGWGLQVLAHLMRAEHYELLEDQGDATEHFRSFLDARSRPDPLSNPGWERAQQGITRLRSRSPTQR